MGILLTSERYAILPARGSGVVHPCRGRRVILLHLALESCYVRAADKSRRKAARRVPLHDSYFSVEAVLVNEKRNGDSLCRGALRDHGT